MRKEHPYRIGIIQMRCAADPAVNMEKIIGHIRDAARQGAQVICTPELFRSQYFCQREDTGLFSLAESIPGPTTETLGRLARELDVVLVASLFERRAAGIYHNTAAVLDADGSLAGLYRKMHIPDDPLYYEKYYFTPGDLGYKVFAVKHGRIGVLICWDQWYPEAARLTAMQNCSVLFYPTAIGWHPAEKAEYGAPQVSAWQTMQRSHAIANGVYVASPNRVGHEGAADGGLEFFGHSFICDPFGRLLQEVDEHQEGVLVAEVNPAAQETVRQNWPFFRDRRIDSYQHLAQRFCS